MRFLTGLKFDLINSNPNFFNRGQTNAIFHVWENLPRSSDVLTILVIDGSIFGSKALRMFVSMSFSSQDFVFMDLMIRYTLLSVMVTNQCIVGAPTLDHPQNKDFLCLNISMCYGPWE